MKILVANLGSTSFKYRLFDMSTEQELARGNVERIGSPQSRSVVRIGDFQSEQTVPIADHAVAVEQCLQQLTHPEHGCLQQTSDVSAIGFKAVHGGRISGVQRVNEDVLQAMEKMNQVAPAHNPPYINAMRLLASKLPDLPLVAAFETGFHQTIAPRLRHFGVPRAWAQDHFVQRCGFHGASHRYIAGRTAELEKREDLRIISCHLGGSSSLCAIRDGKSVATSMGMSPQSGVPQNNRVGDFDVFAIPGLLQATGLSLEELLNVLASESGLLGLSNVSGDIRDIEDAADQGNEDARLALEVYVAEVRRYLGGLLVELGGLDVLVFTGGIGENGARIRQQVCHGLDALGIAIDSSANSNVEGESVISATDSQACIRVIPTNEEIVVARQSKQLLAGAA